MKMSIFERKYSPGYRILGKQNRQAKQGLLWRCAGSPEESFFIT